MPAAFTNRKMKMACCFREIATAGNCWLFTLPFAVFMLAAEEFRKWCGRRVAAVREAAPAAALTTAALAARDKS